MDGLTLSVEWRHAHPGDESAFLKIEGEQVKMINRRQFIGSSLAAGLLSSAVSTRGSDTTKPGSVADAKQADVFPYRAWSFCVYSYNWELLEKYVDAALDRAQAYGINTFELHDYNIGLRGLVDATVQYKYFPKLASKEELTYGTERCSRSQREADYGRLRTLARKIKSKGLKLNIWYHVLRQAPAELFTEYPEIRDLDSGFVWTYLRGLFREFFERLPEVDRVTITSLHETPSIMSTSGTLSRDERLLKLYRELYESCHDAGKELIIRDFIVQSEDFASFWDVINKLPPDVYIMTKDILADWTHMDMAPNPFLRRYVGRKLIVEFDLYGEYWGRLDIPVCYPEYIHRQIRTIKAFDVLGAVGRVIHEELPSENFTTIFDSPNEVNCYAFGKYLSKPLPWLAPGSFTDPREKLGRWGWDLDAFDKSIWMEWASRRYGKRAAIPMIRALRRTPEIMSLATDIGGRGFQAHSYVPGVRSTSFLWEPFVDRVRVLGMDFLTDEKRQATQLTRQCLEDVKTARPALAKEDYQQLAALFEGELLIIRAYETVLEGYYQLYLAQQQTNTGGLTNAGANLRKLAAEIQSVRSANFFGRLPATLKDLAEYIEAGKAPTVIAGS